MNNRFDHPGRWRFLMVPFVLVLLAAASGAVMFLWNHLLPEIFGIKSVTFWQAAGLLVLCRLLFGRFGPGHHGHHHHQHHHRNRHHQHHHDAWERARHERRKGAQRALREKLMQMNEEERKLFTEEWKKRMRR